jgi:hypothetical protein
MALNIEDGTGKPDSDSYVTVAEARAYAAARGITLSSDDAAVEALLVQAMDYLEAQRARYQGSKTKPGVQALQWPRTGVVIDCQYNLPDNIIPTELKSAQKQAALEVFAGLSLMPSSDGRVVKREKVDVIETEYMTGQDLGSGASMGPSFPAVDALLEPLFNACGGGFFLKTVRV